MCVFAWGMENIADRHSIRINGGYRVHQIPSKPGRGISIFTFCLSKFLTFLRNYSLAFSHLK